MEGPAKVSICRAQGEKAYRKALIRQFRP